MEYQISFLSRVAVNNLVINSKNYRNSLSLIIPIQYIESLVSLNWSDILCLIQYGYCKKSDAIEYALATLAEESEDLLYNLAIWDKEDVDNPSYMETIMQLSEKIPYAAKQDTERKVMYAVLSFLYDKRIIIEDPEQVLDIIFDDFNFLIDFRDTMDRIHCMRKTKTRREQIFNLWHEFLESQKNTFKHDTFA